MNNAALCTLEQQARTKLTPTPTRHPMTAETSPTGHRTISPTSAWQPKDHTAPAPIRSHETLTTI